MVEGMRALIMGTMLATLAAVTGGQPAAAESARGVQIMPATAAATAPPAAVPAERRVALVIGNGAYRNAPPLTNPPNDARTVATALTGAGFELVGGKALIDLDRAGTENAIRSFGQQLRGGAIGLFYYAGHGLQISGTNYLVPVSAQLASEADVKYELVDVNFVLDEMVQAVNRLNMILLDACRNNPFGGRGLRSVSGGLAQMQAPSGTVISYATQPGNVAADGSGGNSPYTAALAETIRQPGRSVFEVFNDVGIAVKKKTGGAQQPWLSTSPIEGQFYFEPASTEAAESVPAPTAAPPPSSADKEALYWESIKDSHNPAFYRAYLEQFPTGVFAGLARAKLASITPAAPALAPTPAPAFDPETVPYLTEQQKAGLREYQTGASPKALAISKRGHFAYLTNGNGELTEDDARRRVLERCQFLAGTSCMLYSVSGLVLQPDTRSLAPTPVTIRSSGRFDPAAVPFVAQTVRNTKMPVFAAARTHKALAIHPSGAWATATGRESVEAATTVALQNCAQFKEKGCMIYAVDDEIVLAGPEDGAARRQ